MEPKRLDWPLVVDCSVCHKPNQMFQVDLKNQSSRYLPKIVSVILGSSYHAVISSSVHSPHHFGFGDRISAGPPGRCSATDNDMRATH